MSEAGALQKVLSGDLCAGCGLCADVFGAEKVDMKMQAPGYLRPFPKVALSPEEEVLFSDICPGVRLDLKSSDVASHPLWGPIVKVRVGWATDAGLRHAGSSGGVLSALLAFLLEGGEVAYALHTTMSSASPIDNETVESKDTDGVLRAAGSRYAPSSPLEDLSTHLSLDKRFVFLGKPCDVAGARALAHHDERVDRLVPYMLSFFCAGVPSAAGTREILKQMGVNEDELVSFRYRGDGWPGFATAKSRDGQLRRMSYADSWGKILSHHVQFRCKICPDGTGGFADVACGDAWECDEKGYPLFDEDEGRSLIISRTARGERLIGAAMEAGYIQAQDLDVEEISKMQPGQLRRKQLLQSRLWAMRLLARLLPQYQGLKLAEAAQSVSIFEKLRSFAGMSRRLLLRKIDRP